MSLQEVADACAINIRQYQKFESGERDVRGCAFSLGMRICKTLNLDPWVLAQSLEEAEIRKSRSSHHSGIASSTHSLRLQDASRQLGDDA